MIDLLKTLFFAPLATGLSFFTPIADERIKFFQVYLKSIGPYEALKQQRERSWVYLWMASAARRQKWQNRLNAPGYYELQRRMWERPYAYGFVVKRVVFWWALFHGAECSDVLLKAHAPAIYRLIVTAVFALRHLQDHLLDALFGWML